MDLEGVVVIVLSRVGLEFVLLFFGVLEFGIFWIFWGRCKLIFFFLILLIKDGVDGDCFIIKGDSFEILRISNLFVVFLFLGDKGGCVCYLFVF